MKDFEDAMLDVAWKNLDNEEKRYKDIDAKAIGLITITGILMTFLMKPVSPGSKILFFLTAISFLATILLSVIVIRVRSAEGLSTTYLIEDFKEEKPERQIRGLIGTIAATERTLREVCNTKANELRCAVYALGLGVGLLILYALSTFL